MARSPNKLPLHPIPDNTSHSVKPTVKAPREIEVVSDHEDEDLSFLTVSKSIRRKVPEAKKDVLGQMTKKPAAKALNLDKDDPDAKLVGPGILGSPLKRSKGELNIAVLRREEDEADKGEPTKDNGEHEGVNAGVGGQATSNAGENAHIADLRDVGHDVEMSDSVKESERAPVQDRAAATLEPRGDGQAQPVSSDKSHDSPKRSKELEQTSMTPAPRRDLQDESSEEESPDVKQSAFGFSSLPTRQPVAKKSSFSKTPSTLAREDNRSASTLREQAKTPASRVAHSGLDVSKPFERVHYPSIPDEEEPKKEQKTKVETQVPKNVARSPERVISSGKELGTPQSGNIIADVFRKAKQLLFDPVDTKQAKSTTLSPTRSQSKEDNLARLAAPTFASSVRRNATASPQKRTASQSSQSSQTSTRSEPASQLLFGNSNKTNDKPSGIPIASSSSSSSISSARTLTRTASDDSVASKKTTASTASAKPVRGGLAKKPLVRPRTGAGAATPVTKAAPAGSKSNSSPPGSRSVSATSDKQTPSVANTQSRPAASATASVARKPQAGPTSAARPQTIQRKAPESAQPRSRLAAASAKTTTESKDNSSVPSKPKVASGLPQKTPQQTAHVSTSPPNKRKSDQVFRTPLPPNKAPRIARIASGQTSAASSTASGPKSTDRSHVASSSTTTPAATIPKVDGVMFSSDKLKFANPSADTSSHRTASQKSTVTPSTSKTPSAGSSVPAARLFPHLKLTTPKPPPQQPKTELPEIESDSEDESDGNVLASWANTPELRNALIRQQVVDPDSIFGPIAPLQFDEVFKTSSRLSRFRPRSSSANWSGQDRLTQEEREEYARTMGYK